MENKHKEKNENLYKTSANVDEIPPPSISSQYEVLQTSPNDAEICPPKETSRHPASRKIGDQSPKQILSRGQRLNGKLHHLHLADSVGRKMIYPTLENSTG